MQPLPLRLLSKPQRSGCTGRPLAFITDRHSVATTLWNGGRVGLVTFEDHASKMESIVADLQEIRPTVLKGVAKPPVLPAFFSDIRLSKSYWLEQVPKFWQEIQVAARMQHDVGLKVLGGRTHTLICGAGALDPSVAAWYGSLSVAGKPLQFIGALSPACLLLPPQHNLTSS